MLRYDEETINVLVRDALAFEKKKKFNEAIEIYEELAIQGVEFAIERIPIAKHRFDNQKLRRMELFTNIISACAIGVGIVSISYNMTLNLISNNDINSYFAFSKTQSQISSPLIPNITYNSIEKEELNTNTGFEIFIQGTISKKEISNRAIEAIESYIYQVPINQKQLIININSIRNKKTEHIGYIELNLDNKSECNIFLIKDYL